MTNVVQFDQEALRQEQRQAFLAKRDWFIASWLEEIGMAPFEKTATFEQIPEAIRNLLPPAAPNVNFGLVGSYGCGKTFAVAALLRRRAENRIDHWMASQVEKGEFWGEPHSVWRWCNWPQDAAKARGMVAKQGDEVENWIESLQSPNRAIVLDDLGAERATSGDWIGETLGRIVDERLRNQTLTLWTSNLTPQELAARYGARLYSRLHALAPPILLPKLPDLRLRPIQSTGGSPP
jgi:hypothetical protein